MKKILFLALLLGSVAGFTQTIKETCQNAYYATGYVKLDQYKVVVNYDEMSPQKIYQFEESLKVFKILDVKQLENNMIFTLKDEQRYDLTYDIEALNEMDGVRVSCKYDI